jgi:hypothetical protein
MCYITLYVTLAYPNLPPQIQRQKHDYFGGMSDNAQEVYSLQAVMFNISSIRYILYAPYRFTLGESIHHV